MKHLRIFNSIEEFEAVKSSIDTPFVVLEEGTPKVIYSNIKEITEPEIPNYLCFEAIEDNSTLKFVKNGNISPNLEYSTDNGTNWNTYNLNDPNTINLNLNEKVYFRGNNTTISTSENDYCYFVGTGQINISGNILSLLSKELNPIDTAPDYCFYRLFSYCDAFVSAENLILPFNIVGNKSYKHMFYNCKSLTQAPALPATTLANGCYERMFWSCSSLTTAPELKATQLAEDCYMGIFQGCRLLTTAPALPATTLANSCYWSMFTGCTSLTQAPALPATTLAKNCYYTMFSDCTSLTTAPALPATTLAGNCYYGMFHSCKKLSRIKCLYEGDYNIDYFSGWVRGVASSGTFIKSANADVKSWPSGQSGIPTGWTVVDEP